jgi:hypothetical protein
MPRGRTQRVHEAKRLILERLRNGLFRPGDRFASNRQISDQHNLSYQTAHRLIDELCKEGYLIRKPRSGTYVAGKDPSLRGVQLVFGSRAKRKGSFGAKLLATLRDRLEANRVDAAVTWDATTIKKDRLPVMWEAPDALASFLEEERPGLLINDRPAASIGSRYIDSVGLDDYSGGAYAAQLLLRNGASVEGLAVLAGPENDRRSADRLAGFRSVASKAPVIYAGGWFYEDGFSVAKRAVTAATSGLFCCNDRLAQSVTSWCEENDTPRPKLVGFDNAPIAVELNITTIAIPWEELVESATRVIKRRLSGDRSVASHQILNPRPVVRKI